MILLLMACAETTAMWSPTVLPQPNLVTELEQGDCLLVFERGALGLAGVENDQTGYGGQVWDLVEGPFSLGQRALQAGSTGSTRFSLGGVQEREEGLWGGTADAALTAELGSDAWFLDASLTCEDTLALTWRAPSYSADCPALELEPQTELSSVYDPGLGALLEDLSALPALDTDGDGEIQGQEWPALLAWTQDGAPCEVSQ